MSFLESFQKEDLGVFVAGNDYIGVQTMNEKFSQTVAYRSCFGFAFPVIRTITPADSNEVSFSFILLKAGVTKGLSEYRILRRIQDFTINTKKGSLHETYENCNWTDISIDSAMDGVTVSVNASMPGFVPGSGSENGGFTPETIAGSIF